MSPCKAIIFDLGNVVFNCFYEPTFEYWAKLAGVSTKQLKQKLNMDDETHADFEKSLIGADRFRQHISDQIGYNLTTEEFEQGGNTIYSDVVSGIDDLLIALRKRHRIIALTNTNVTHAKTWKEKYKDTLKLFEKVFASHEIGLRKPEPEAYQVCLDYLGMIPDDVIFLDDNIKNVEGARKLGINSILVESFDQMEADLKQIGIATRNE